MLHDNPADRVPLPRIAQHEMRHLDPDALAALADAIGEIAGLRRRRVDLPRRRIAVAEIAVEVSAMSSSASPRPRPDIGRCPSRSSSPTSWPRSQPGPEGSCSPPRTAGSCGCQPSPRRVWLPAVERAGLAPPRIHDLSRRGRRDDDRGPRRAHVGAHGPRPLHAPTGPRGRPALDAMHASARPSTRETVIELSH